MLPAAASFRAPLSSCSAVVPSCSAPSAVATLGCTSLVTLAVRLLMALTMLPSSKPTLSCDAITLTGSRSPGIAALGGVSAARILSPPLMLTVRASLISGELLRSCASDAMPGSPPPFAAVGCTSSAATTALLPPRPVSAPPSGEAPLGCSIGSVPSAVSALGCKSTAIITSSPLPLSCAA